MITATRPPRNAFEREARKVYHFLGFQKGYNFTLWFIFGGALFGFVLSRLMFLNFDGQFCPKVPTNRSAPLTQCYWLSIPRYRVGTQLHLFTVLPAGLLAVFQFVPAIRHRFILYHRLAGYAIILLIVVGNVGAVMIADRSFGGDLTTQVFTGFMAIVTTTTFGLALYNIKRLQIDQHRAWMLRTWFYLGFIISLRIIQIFMAMIISVWPYETQYNTISCDELSFFYRNSTILQSKYPSCAPGNDAFTTDGRVVVKSHYGHKDLGQLMASFNVTFGAAGFLAVLLHAIGVEIYLKMTPREAERLRQVSYERQRARGFRNPGSAGLVVERFGDAEPWYPREDPLHDKTFSLQEELKGDSESTTTL